MNHSCIFKYKLPPEHSQASNKIFTGVTYMWLRDRKKFKNSLKRTRPWLQSSCTWKFKFPSIHCWDKSNGAALTATIKKEHEWKWAASCFLKHLHGLYEKLSMRAHFKHLNSNTIWIFITPRGCHWDREMINCAKSAF